MTISSETNRSSVYTTDGATVQFSFSMDIDADTDLEVWYRPTGGTYSQLTLTTHYTVTGLEGGYITTCGASSPYAAGNLVIIRKGDKKQLLDLVATGNFSPDNVENALDKLTKIALRQQEELDRAPKTPIHSTTKDLTFPEPEAGKAIGWNAGGDDLENRTLSTTVVIPEYAANPPSPALGQIWILNP